jgi:PAS domain S-box-containing protein
MDASDGSLLDAFEDVFPDTGFVFDAEGTIVRAFAGPEVDRLVGDDPTAVVGNSLAESFDGDTAEKVQRQITHTVESQRLQTREYVIGSGTTARSFEARMAPVAAEGDTALVAAIFRDVTTRDLYAQRLDESNRILQTIRESTQAISRATSVAELHDSICDIITNSTPYQFAWVGRYDESADGLVPVTRMGRADRYIDTLDLQLEPVEGRRPPPPVDAGQRREPAVVPNLDDIAPGAEWYDHATKEGFHSIGAFPILDDGFEGVLTVYAERPYAFGFNERRLFTELCRDMADAKTAIKTQRRVEDQQAALEARNVEWEVLNRIVRHDIRNKMTVVQGRAELLAEDVDEDSRGHVDQILDNSERVIEITKEARHVAETLAETEEIDREAVDLADTLRTEIDDLRKMYPEAEVRVDGAVPDVSVTANDFLSSLFRNVLTNAVIHNDRPRPEVDVSATVTDDTAVVDIADNGPGIPAEVRETVFEAERFAPDKDGHGVGLYLVNSLASQYGGDIDIDTSGSRGTVVSIELPLYGRA